jgi:hypothetical protein
MLDECDLRPDQVKLIAIRFSLLPFAANSDRRCLGAEPKPAAMREMIASVAGVDGFLEDLNGPLCLFV